MSACRLSEAQDAKAKSGENVISKLYQQEYIKLLIVTKCKRR